jgi:hypothetical protein
MITLYKDFVRFFLKFWILYRSDDGLDDGSDVVN